MLLIQNAKILPMTGPRIDKGCVLIKEGKIAQVAPQIEATPHARVLDVKGAWVLPGLIEAHSHIGISEERKGIEGDDCNEMTTPLTPHLRALDAINPMDSAFHNALSAGVTAAMVGPGSANVVGGQFMVLKTYGRDVARMCVKAPAAMKVAFGENPKTNYSGKGVMPATRMSIAAMLREELYKACDYREQKRRAQQNADAFPPDFRMECYLPVLDGRIPLKAHVHRADDILTAIRIAQEFGVRMTLDHCTEGHLIAQEIRQSGFPAIVGPSLASRNKVEVQYLDFKTAGVLAQAGVKVALPPDPPVPLIQYLPLCAGLAAKHGLGVEEGLRAITLYPAQILGVDDRMGSIEVGKDADLAIFDGNPMEVFTHTLYTLVDGEIVFDHRA